MPKRFLVTGGAGFIGSAFVRHAIAATDHHVLVVDKLTYAGNLDSLAPVKDHPRFRFVRADIADAAAMKAALRRLPARTSSCIWRRKAMSIARSTGRPRSCRPTSSAPSSCCSRRSPIGARCQRPRRSGFRFHHVSTDEVFGSLDAHGHVQRGFALSAQFALLGVEGGSDHLVRAWHHTYGLPVFISNCSNNFGPYHFPEKLIPLTILNALEGKPLPVYGKGENVRDWLYVEDHARALLVIAERGRVGESYNVGGQLRAVKHRRGARDLRADGRACSRRGRPARAADHLRRRPARPRSALRHGRAQSSARSSAGRRRRRSNRGCARRWNGI